MRATLLLVGTTLGAGIFVLPYFFSQAGILPSLLGLSLLTILTITINLFYAKIILATPGDHQLAGYAQYYFGLPGRWIATLALFLSLLGALTAYIILGGNFLQILVGKGGLFFWRFIFLGFALIAFHGGLRKISLLEAFLTSILIFLALSLPFLGWPSFDWHHFHNLGVQPLAFYGPMLFALSGLAIIPEVEEILRKRRRLLPAAVVSGTILVAIIYLVFSLGVWGVVGPKITPDTLTSLTRVLPMLGRLGAILGVLSCFTSFLGLENVLREMFYRDFSFSFLKSNSLTIMVPVLGLILPELWLTKILALTGSVAIGLTNILVSLIFAKRAKGRGRFLALFVIILFALGLVSLWR